VKVVTLIRDNDEVTFAKPGENLRIRISRIRGEGRLPGIRLCSRSECRRRQCLANAVLTSLDAITGTATDAITGTDTDAISGTDTDAITGTDTDAVPTPSYCSY